MKVIKLIESAHPLRLGNEIEGQYLVECDVDDNDGRGRIDTTYDITKAMKFNDAAEALQYWRRQSTVAPLRTDGKPNRPLTAYTIEVMNADEAHTS